jgi:sucrose phosphorylase
VLHALFTKDAEPLKRWLAISPRNSVTVLDTHDGIGVIDVGADSDGTPGLLAPQQINHLVETIHERSGGQSKQATGAAASNLDLYQVNCTYYDALGCRDNEYLIARAIQFFAPGVPQIYYVGLLGEKNDMELLARSGVGRDINRHYFTPAEVQAAVNRPMVQSLFSLIRFRNQHPAFNGEFQIEPSAANRILFRWANGDQWARLDVDLETMSANITYSSDGESRCLSVTQAAGGPQGQAQ